MEAKALRTFGPHREKMKDEKRQGGNFRTDQSLMDKGETAQEKEEWNKGPR